MAEGGDLQGRESHKYRLMLNLLQRDGNLSSGSNRILIPDDAGPNH